MHAFVRGSVLGECLKGNDVLQVLREVNTEAVLLAVRSRCEDSDFSKVVVGLRLGEVR
jgi:hypothetical protein